MSSKTIALEDGYLDEQIRLLGEDGKREIRAKISGISSAIALKIKKGKNAKNIKLNPIIRDVVIPFRVFVKEREKGVK